MKAKVHWVWLVAKERKLGLNNLGSLRVKAFPRAAAVYDWQLRNENKRITDQSDSQQIPLTILSKVKVCGHVCLHAILPF